MDKEQWQALKNHDGTYDGRFYCGLLRRKVFCKPSCAAYARRINDVVILESLDAALTAGYQPCPHCRPDLPHWQGPRQALADAARRYIEDHFNQKFSLDTLAEALYVNGSYLLRTFKQINGCTPLVYHNRVRCEHAKRLLQQNEYTVSAAGEQCGFISPAHFSHVFKKTVGMTPTAYRNAYYRELDS